MKQSCSCLAPLPAQNAILRYSSSSLLQELLINHVYHLPLYCYLLGVFEALLSWLRCWWSPSSLGPLPLSVFDTSAEQPEVLSESWN